MKHSDSLASIAPALVKAINAIEGVKKDASNPHFKSKFATLEAVIEAAHPHLASNGLTVLQGPGLMQGNALTVSTRILHESGEWIETEFAIPMAKQDPQAAGSALTYARRYSLMAVLNMPAVDDDGESAMQRGPKTPSPGTISVQPEGPDWWGAKGNGMSAANAKKEGWGETMDGWLGSIPMIPTLDALREWRDQNDADIKRLPKGWRVMIREAVDARRAEL
jgi:hypothetical protein